jgi:outer membrane protein TolC
MGTALLVVVVQLSSGVGVTPPREVKLTLRESTELALRNNLALEIARYSPLSAEQDIESAWGAFDWTVHAGPSFTSTTQPTASALVAPQSKSMDWDLGVRQLTPIGISYDLTATTRRHSTNFAFATLNPSYSTSLGMTLTAPILRGFGLDAAYATVVVAQKNRALSERQFEQTLVQTIYDVEKAYWDLVFAREDLKVKQQSLEVARTLLQNNRERFNAGLVARIEVTRADAEVAARLEAILSAENAVANAGDALRSLIDPAALRGGMATQEILVPVDPPREPAAPLEEEAALTQALGEALAMRPELAGLKFRQEAQDLLVEQAEDAGLPKLDLVASGRLLGLGRHFDDRNFDELFDKDTHTWSAGLELEIPLGNWSAQAALMKAQLERRRLNLQLRQLHDQIIVEARKAVRSIKSSEQRIEAGVKSVAAAQENYEAEEARRRAGDATSFEVLDALEDYTAAKTTALRARIDYTMALVDLQRAAGTILRERGVVPQSQLTLRQSSP